MHYQEKTAHKIGVWLLWLLLITVLLSLIAPVRADEAAQTLHDKIVIQTPGGLVKRDVPTGSTVAQTINHYKAQGVFAASLHTVSHCAQTLPGFQTVPAAPVIAPSTFPNPFPAIMAPLSNDPYSTRQTNLYTSGWGSLAPVSNVKPVIVAVIDSGIDPNHPDLPPMVAGHSWITYKINPVWNMNVWRLYKPGQAGYVAHFLTANGSEWRDELGHGTHCAGIIGAIADNGVGIAGIAGRCNIQIMPLKVLNSAGQGGTGDVASAVRYAADNGAQVINMSLGGDYVDYALQDACQYANSRGVVIVCAAGNSGHSLPFYPAACPGVISVGAINRYGVRNSWSNFGSWVTIQTAGNSIFSTFPSYPVTMGGRNYQFLSGTSMAAPQVAGEAAYLFASHPGWTAAQVIAELKRAVSLHGADAPVANLSLLLTPTNVPVLAPGVQ